MNVGDERLLHDLRNLYDVVVDSKDDSEANRQRRLEILRQAMYRLAYPDRDVYPKTRRGIKGAPIVRK